MALTLLIKLLKQFEGCELNAYQDIVGVWTIGYGETKNVKKGDVWTQAQADQTLETRAIEFMHGVLKLCPALADESPNKLAACTSLAYNIGLGAFGTSTVCKKTKSMEYESAANAFLLWCKAGGKVVRGLENRRRIERATYLNEGVL
jgi:lysozyme